MMVSLLVTQDDNNGITSGYQDDDDGIASDYQDDNDGVTSSYQDDDDGFSRSRMIIVVSLVVTRVMMVSLVIT